MSFSNPIRSFLPGPVWVDKEVRQALSEPVINHRSSEFGECYQEVTEGLKALFRTEREVMVITGSATLAMEAMVRSSVKGRVLNLTNGAFSERFYEIAELNGIEAETLAFPWGEAVDPDRVTQKLRQGNFDAVTLAHCETSTGVLNPVRDVARAVRAESDALVLVDAVSSLGGAPLEMDTWGLDCVVTGAQKAMALPPGLAFVSFSTRAEKRMEQVPRRGFYTDLLRYIKKHREGGTITTAAVSLFWALRFQIRRILEQGVEQRWKEHQSLQDQVIRWAPTEGLKIMAPRDHRSPTVSCLGTPEGLSASKLVQELGERGWTLGSGYGSWKSHTFRIGHMAAIQPSDLKALLAEISIYIGENDASHPHI